jgi:sulfate permease, SulP family
MRGTAVSATSSGALALRMPPWLVQVSGGTVGSLVSLAVVLTLGLLAYAPLGAMAPEVGIPAAFTAAVVGGLAMALLASSALPTAGPSSATALILAALVAKLVADPALHVTRPDHLAAVIALASASIVVMGVLQVVFGLLRLGSVAKYVPQPALAGFMNGVAILILLSQIPALLGLTRIDLDRHGWQALAGAQPATLVVGLVTALSVWVVARRFPRAPATLAGLAIGCLVFFAVRWAWPSVALGPQAGALPHELPLPNALLPLLHGARELLAAHLYDVLLTGLLLAVIGALESLMSTLAVDQTMGVRTRSNRELVALGAANVVSGAFGGVPLVYLRARAMATLNAGGRTRLAAVAGCIALGVIFFAGARLLAYLPLAVLAGLMVIVSFALIDGWTRQLIVHWRKGDHISEARRNLVIVAAVCVVTLWLGFVAGVLLGVVLSMLEFARAMTLSLLRSRYTGAQRASRRQYPPAAEALLRTLRESITVLELEGALYFGSVARLTSEVDRLQPRPSHLVIDFTHVTTVDATGAVMLAQLSRHVRREGIRLLLAAITPESRHGSTVLAHNALDSDAQWCEDVDRAIERAELDLLATAGQPLRHAAVDLAQCALLHGLTAEEVDRLRALMPARSLRAGEALFRQGDPGEELFVLTSGSISIVSGALRFLSFSPGMTFGEVALLDGSGRSADAVADTDAVVHALSRTDLASLELSAPLLVSRLYRNLAAHLSGRLRGASLRR